MNRFENWFCASSLWRRITQHRLLPWLLNGADLGEHVLELGAGPGAATAELSRRAGRVTSLEHDHTFAKILRSKSTACEVVQGDAAILPFPSHTFTSVVAILVLHHLRSTNLQDRTFAEIYRVLKPRGVFTAFEISDGWISRVAHIKSTFIPVSSSEAISRLKTAGFSDVAVDLRRGGFRLSAIHPGAA